MASQITATLPTLDFPKEVDYPTQEDWSAFSVAAEENFGILGGDWSTQMQLWKIQANAMSTELNNNSNIAQSVANYQGDWISQGYTLNQSVSVNGIYYVCKLTHTTGQNPTAGGSLYWNLVIGNWNLKADKTETNALTTSVNTINNQLDTHISLSGVTAYHLLGGNLTTTITANYIETSATTTRNYTTSDYIFDSANNKLYDCILASTAGVLLTNTTYFTSIIAGTLSINNSLIPLAHGIDSNGSKNSIVVANETITGVTYTEGKNYLYKTDTGYGVKPYEPRYLASELVRNFAGEQPDYYDVESNKWFNCDTGAELVTNGTFSSGVTTGWTLSGSCVISNNTMLISNSGANASQTITGLDPLKKYRLKGNMAFVSGTNIGWFTVNGVTYGNVAANYQLDIVVSGVSQIVLSLNVGTTAVYSFDNITCFQEYIVPTTEITESRNYLNHIVHADADSGVLYVEELPKIEYKNVIKAEEYLGKNACTGWVNFDGTTTPPTIRDSYNVSAVIRIGAGQYEVYFKEDMNNNKYSSVATQGYQGSIDIPSKYINKVYIVTRNAAFTAQNDINISIHIMGGKN